MARRSAAAGGALSIVFAALAFASLPAAGAAPTRAHVPGAAVAAPTAPSSTGSSSTTTSTTVPPPTTTTTAPPTTTTEAATTTRPVRTTTTTSPTTTTTVTGQSTSSTTPWALIAVIVVLVAAIVLVALLLRSRRRRGVEADWRRAVVPALSDARLARESLLSGNAASDDPEVLGAVSIQVERAAVALERTVRTAPDPQAGAMSTSAAGALRGLAFAVEADRLLRHGTSAPSGAQLAQADEARRARTAELNTALTRLSTRVGAQPGAGAAH
ncbi:MAG TPA: hypothetical protein VMV06_12310 [Acidimicrobiales bacterium]|nr:hypothetical protein [Acidimicrobiales bacterium]